MQSYEILLSQQNIGMGDVLKTRSEFYFYGLSLSDAEFLSAAVMIDDAYF